MGVVSFESADEALPGTGDAYSPSSLNRRRFQSPMLPAVESSSLSPGDLAHLVEEKKDKRGRQAAMPRLTSRDVKRGQCARAGLSRVEYGRYVWQVLRPWYAGSSSSSGSLVQQQMEAFAFVGASFGLAEPR